MKNLKVFGLSFAFIMAMSLASCGAKADKAEETVKADVAKVEAEPKADSVKVEVADSTATEVADSTAAEADSTAVH